MTQTVTLLDVVNPSGLRVGRITTAHGHVARFYRSFGPMGRAPSILEQIARARSPFSVDIILADVELLRAGDERARVRWKHAAAARKAELRGELFVPGGVR